MSRIRILAIVAAAALASLVILNSGEPVRAGALPSNIPGDATCSQTADARDALYDILYIENIQVGLACQTNGNVICGNNIDLADAIQILRYAAGLSTALPPFCPPIGVDAAHETVDKGTDLIHGSYIFNLDDGTESADGGDLWWSIQSSPPLVAHLEPYSGTQFARIDSFLAFSDISYSQLVGAEFQSEPMDSSEIPVGTVLAVKTSEGNYAKVKILTVAQDMEIQWVTYSPPDS